MPSTRYPKSLKLFRCEPLHASLAPATCAQNYVDRRIIQCVTCQIGRRHAERLSPVRTPDLQIWEPARACVRCCVGSYRLLRGRLCVSCYNREREVRVGTNGKGAAPVKARKLLHRAVCIMTEAGKTRLLELEYCSGPDEAKRVIEREWPHARLSNYQALPLADPIPPTTRANSLNSPSRSGLDWSARS